MIDDILYRYLHFLAIIVLVGAVMAQHLMLKKTVRRSTIALAGRINKLYSVAAIVVLLTGLAQWFLTGKPAEYYTKNPVFHVKFTLFIVAALLTIKTTIFLKKNREGDPGDEITVPGGVILLKRIELLVLLLMPLLGTLVAWGMGLRVES